MKKYSILETIKHWHNFKLKVIFEGLLVGIITGFVVVFYRLLLSKASSIRIFILDKIHGGSIPYIFAWFIFLVVIAVLLGFLVKKIPMIKGSGIPQIKGVLIRQLKMDWLKEVVAKFFGGVFAIGFGLSLGREGPSVQLGSGIGLGVSSILKRHHTEEKYLITSGASAGLAAAFNAPLAGVIFALEELHKNFSPLLLTCVMGASLTADFVSKQFFGFKPVFDFQNVTPLPLNNYLFLIGLGILVGSLGAFFNYSLLRVQSLYENSKKVKEEYRILIPFMIAGILGLFMPQMLGGGHGLIEDLVHGDFLISAILLFILIKFTFTIISYGSGAPGGIFLPLLVIGALVGKVYGLLLVEYFNLDPTYVVNFIILGMAAHFTAIVRAPITGGILILEMTNSFQHLLALILVSLVTFMFVNLMEQKPIYDSLLDRILHKNNGKKLKGNRHKKIILEIPVSIASKFEHKNVNEVTWPEDCLIIGIHRGEEEIIPHGNTTIYQGDRLLILTHQDQMCHVKPMLLSMGQEDVEVIIAQLEEKEL